MSTGFWKSIIKSIKQDNRRNNLGESITEAAKNKVHVTKSKSGIVVKGIDDMAVRFSRCCNPVREMRLSGLLRGEEECPFTEQIV